MKPKEKTPVEISIKVNEKTISTLISGESVSLIVGLIYTFIDDPRFYSIVKAAMLEYETDKRGWKNMYKKDKNK